MGSLIAYNVNEIQGVRNSIDLFCDANILSWKDKCYKESRGIKLIWSLSLLDNYSTNIHQNGITTMGWFQYFGHLYRVFNHYLIDFEGGRLTRARLIMKMIMLVTGWRHRLSAGAIIRNPFKIWGLENSTRTCHQNVASLIVKQTSF